ncbi:MAG: hypothetical protein AAGD96_02035 [Chloroflexota bacterium]
MQTDEHDYAVFTQDLDIGVTFEATQTALPSLIDKDKHVLTSF